MLKAIFEAFRASNLNKTVRNIENQYKETRKALEELIDEDLKKEGEGWDIDTSSERYKMQRERWGKGIDVTRRHLEDLEDTRRMFYRIMERYRDKPFSFKHGIVSNWADHVWYVEDFVAHSETNFLFYDWDSEELEIRQIKLSEIFKRFKNLLEEDSSVIE